MGGSTISLNVITKMILICVEIFVLLLVGDVSVVIRSIMFILPQNIAVYLFHLITRLSVIKMNKVLLFIVNMGEHYLC